LQTERGEFCSIEETSPPLSAPQEHDKGSQTTNGVACATEWTTNIHAQNVRDRKLCPLPAENLNGQSGFFSLSSLNLAHLTWPVIAAGENRYRTRGAVQILLADKVR
jgi:hypothetical protein